jgi:hypothetical protein
MDHTPDGITIYSSVWVLKVSVHGWETFPAYFVSVPGLEKMALIVKDSLELLDGVRFDNFRGLSGNLYAFDLTPENEEPTPGFASLVKVPYKGQD